jgi:insecticidal toxin complex protein TccC
MPAGASSYAHTGTPTVVVSDARGLLLRTVQFHRREAGHPVDSRVTQQCFDAAGRLTASRDPYLFDLSHTDALTPFNLSQVTSLSGLALMTDSVDAGQRVVLHGAAGQPLEHWDGRGCHSLTEYDELLRPVAVRESGREVAEHTLERFTYADASPESAARNLCGQRVRHDDPAGTVHIRDLSITGNVLSRTRMFLTGTEAPDWPADVAGRDARLEPGDGASTAYTFAPGSELLNQTDAFGNVQAFAYTLDGLLKNTKLTLDGAGQTEKLLVSAIHYNASGQIESETAGNGVITRHRYDEANGLLTELSAHKADGTPLQDLKYHYDAVGNVLCIEDSAQPIRYFANQRIAPLKTYRYDTLYQLIEATGCEAKTGSGGPALPDFQALPLDPSQIANYTQTYYYDAGGNLLDLVHVGAQAHGRTLTRARYSNRCLPERDNRPPTEEELANGFDANGNLRELQVGQSLTWDLHNQLREVQPVVREDKEDDCECYIYDGGGQRVRKVHSSLTNARSVIREVRYLPSVEIRSHNGTGETLHVITTSAGSNSVQVLHWVSEPPDKVVQDQVRYSLNDHLKSSALELDQSANLISQEWYYSFGGTACWAGRNVTEATYKTVRYSGKERDATGLYYYGFRYYAPWLQRWLNPDPAGYVDGMNLFAMVKNRPISFADLDGHAGTELTQKDLEKAANTIKKQGEGLTEADTREVTEQYLIKKGADPLLYLDQIMSLAGFDTQPAKAPTLQVKETDYEKKLSKKEIKGIHLFWGTNSGARYINAITRNYFQGEDTQNAVSLSKAENGALTELRENLGSTTIKMSYLTKKDSFEPAIQLLKKHRNEPKQTVLLMKAALGKTSPGVAFRGARLPYTDIKEGDILQTGGFTAFTPFEKDAIEFTKKFHSAEFKEKTSPVLFVTDGGFSINSTSEVERLFMPMTQFKVTGVYTGKNNTPNIFLEKTAFSSDRNIKWI